MTVVLLMLDGVRPDALELADCPNVRNFRSRSAATMDARSVMPSVTLPCHMSIFHSLLPEHHGVSDNERLPASRPAPGLVEVLAAQGRRCGFFYDWEQLRDLSRPGHLHCAWFRDGAERRVDADDAVAAAAARLISAEQLDFAFVYFGTVDTAGHTFGWMSDAYLTQLSRLDRLCGELLAALPAESSVLIQSDHGGHEQTHGSDRIEDMRIPWMLAGPGVRAGHVLTTPVSLLDTAPTLLHLFGIAPPAEWQGRCVHDAFHEA